MGLIRVVWNIVLLMTVIEVFKDNYMAKNMMLSVLYELKYFIMTMLQYIRQKQVSTDGINKPKQ